MLFAFFVLGPFIEIHDELHKTPDKHEKSRRKYNQNGGVDYVRDEIIENLRTVHLYGATKARVHNNTFGNNWIGRGYLERRLQETDDSPNGNHDEDSNKTPEHDLEAFGRIFVIHAPEVLDEAPEEDHYRECDKESDDGIQKLADEHQGVLKRGCARKSGQKQCRDCQTIARNTSAHTRNCVQIKPLSTLMLAVLGQNTITFLAACG